MLNKRAQILFDEKTYKNLEEVAREKGSSVGELVRTAVKRTYEDSSKTKRPVTLAEALKGTFGAWKDHPSADKELISSLSDPWSKPDDIFEKT